MDQIQAFWEAFLATLPEDAPARQETYVAEAFGDRPELADKLLALILAGIKTATCSAVWEWEAQGRALTPVGLKTIVLDGAERPVCIIETTEAVIRPFNQVDAEFAAAEGEGDRSLEYWRRAHWNFFSRALSAIGRAPAEDMPLLCERFRVLYREAGQSVVE